MALFTGLSLHYFIKQSVLAGAWSCSREEPQEKGVLPPHCSTPQNKRYRYDIIILALKEALTGQR